jgi:hypothetical protein
MKPLRLTTLLIVLGLFSCGCSSLTPPAMNSPTLQAGMELGEPAEKAEPENNLGLLFLYGLLNIGGQMLANK